jgi:hypothetical protein
MRCYYLNLTRYMYIHNTAIHNSESKYYEIINKTRGSQEPVIARLVFNLTSKVDRKWGGGVLHITLKVGHPKIISTQISEQKM